jgi:hypothetical protein
MKVQISLSASLAMGTTSGRGSGMSRVEVAWCAGSHSVVNRIEPTNSRTSSTNATVNSKHEAETYIPVVHT